MTTLKDVLPSEFMGPEYTKTKARKLADVEVVEQFGATTDNPDTPWPGSQKNVHFWVRLANGQAVGFNENPARGWGFPVFHLKNSLV